MLEERTRRIERLQPADVGCRSVLFHSTRVQCPTVWRPAVIIGFLFLVAVVGWIVLRLWKFPVGIWLRVSRWHATMFRPKMEVWSLVLIVERVVLLLETVPGCVAVAFPDRL